jgi:hypothetical protein
LFFYLNRWAFDHTLSAPSKHHFLRSKPARFDRPRTQQEGCPKETSGARKLG